MNIKVRYFSESGNTKKVADAIAQELDINAEPITKGISNDTDILFLGGGVYWAGIHGELKNFILSLDNSVKKVAVFSTAAISKSAYKQIKKILVDKNIFVYENEFHCRGEFSNRHKDRPNDEDLNLAKQFAREIMKE